MKSLLFIYNADGGIANALLDTGHRIFKPQDYPCALCMVTYGPFGMKNDWKRFIAGLSYEVKFLHKNELPKSLQSVINAFPCLALQEDGHTSILISGEEFREIKDLDTLKQRVMAVLGLPQSKTR